jgi:hypothetical protein
LTVSFSSQSSPSRYAASLYSSQHPSDSSHKMASTSAPLP